MLTFGCLLDLSNSTTIYLFFFIVKNPATVYMWCYRIIDTTCMPDFKIVILPYCRHLLFYIMFTPIYIYVSKHCWYFYGSQPKLNGLSFSRSWITLFGILWLGTGFESVSHQMMEHLLSGCPLQPLLPLSISVDITIYKTMWRVLNQNLTVGLFHIWSSANLDQCFNWSINVLAKLVLGKMNINSWFIRTNKVPRTWIWFYSLFIRTLKKYLITGLVFEKELSYSINGEAWKKLQWLWKE